jgi:hypothetical protein
MTVAIAEAPETCRRCKGEAMFPWNMSFGPLPGHYCPLCWEILMGMWVMTQNDRKTAIDLVDSTVQLYRDEYGYTLD